jgi:acyl carrier protein
VDQVSLDIIKDCLVSALGLDEVEAKQVTRTTTAADLEKWDSLGHFVLITQLEERFEIQFEDEETVQLGSVEAILCAVASKQQ